MVFLLLDPRELTHLLGYPGVHLPLSVPILHPTEVLGQLEDVMKSSPTRYGEQLRHAPQDGMTVQVLAVSSRFLGKVLEIKAQGKVLC